MTSYVQMFVGARGHTDSILALDLMEFASSGLDSVFGSLCGS